MMWRVWCAVLAVAGAASISTSCKPECKGSVKKDCLRSGVTLVTQCSASRIGNLKAICERWRGPLSVAIYDDRGDLQEENRRKAVGNTQSCAYAVVTVVLKKDKGDYPINRLRNVAWRAAETTHVFMLDVDFFPSQHTYNALRGALAYDRTAIVVPAFSLDFRRLGDEPSLSWSNERDPIVALDRESSAPTNLNELRRCLTRPAALRVGPSQKGRRANVKMDRHGDLFCHPFHHHGSTRFVRWLGASRDAAAGIPGSDEPLPVECFIGEGFEPYVVVESCPRARPPPPQYDEAYVGYGKNKLQWIYDLRRANYTFGVKPRAFVVRDPREIRPKNSSKLSTAVELNFFSAILGPFVLAPKFSTTEGNVSGKSFGRTQVEGISNRLDAAPGPRAARAVAGEEALAE